MSASKKDLEKLGEAWAEKFSKTEKEIGKIYSRLDQKNAKPSELEGADELPIYKCRGKDCTFSTDNIPDLVDHVTDEKVSAVLKRLSEENKKPALEQDTETAKPPLHETTKEFLDCPNCRPKFEKAFKELGWQPPTPKEKPKKGAVDLP